MNSRTSRFLAPSVAALMVVAGCATSVMPADPQVSAALRAPAGQSLVTQAQAAGVQIYECAAKPSDASAYAWTFRAPEAALTDAAGRSIGKHYAGPSWEALDGSKIVGQMVASDPGPDPKAIPWLLLSVKSSAGNGLFTGVSSVQRVQTAGGQAPSDLCTAANAGQIARVPYSATYRFFKA